MHEHAAFKIRSILLSEKCRVIALRWVEESYSSYDWHDNNLKSYDFPPQVSIIHQHSFGLVFHQKPISFSWTALQKERGKEIASSPCLKKSQDVDRTRSYDTSRRLDRQFSRIFFRSVRRTESLYKTLLLQPGKCYMYFCRSPIKWVRRSVENRCIFRG